MRWYFHFWIFDQFSLTIFIIIGADMAKEFLGELQALFFDSFIGWLRNTVIGKAVQKLISMFNPVGAIVQAVITIYNLIQFFIERAKQIAALVSAVLNSIAEIAGGNLKKAVAAVEDSLAKALPMAISFLANLVGIGGLAAKIKEIIQKIRKPIDQAVGKVVGLIVGKAKGLIAKISGVDKPKEELPKNEAEHDVQVNAGLAALDKEQQKEDKDHNGALTQDEAIEAAQRVKAAYPVFKSITPVEQGDRWVFEYVASSKKEIKGFNVEKDVQKIYRQPNQYNSFFEHNLKPEQYFLSDAVQFRYANKAFIEKMNNNPGFRRDILGRYPELKIWMEGHPNLSKSPPGLTWHHNEIPGKLNLVHRADHSTNLGIYHSTGKGGRDIWGGGELGRMEKLDSNGNLKNNTDK